MADHTIKMTVPSITLRGRDVEFDVYIDDQKRGTLAISEGGVDWTPRNKQTTIEWTWSNLAEVLENE